MRSGGGERCLRRWKEFGRASWPSVGRRGIRGVIDEFVFTLPSPLALSLFFNRMELVLCCVYVLMLSLVRPPWVWIVANSNRGSFFATFFFHCGILLLEVSISLCRSSHPATLSLTSTSSPNHACIPLPSTHSPVPFVVFPSTHPWHHPSTHPFILPSDQHFVNAL